jgi:hypothetical protein
MIRMGFRCLRFHKIETCASQAGSTKLSNTIFSPA